MGRSALGERFCARTARVPSVSPPGVLSFRGAFVIMAFLSDYQVLYGGTLGVGGVSRVESRRE